MVQDVTVVAEKHTETRKPPKRTVADLYENIATVNSSKKKKIASKQQYMEKVEEERVQILKIEARIREQQERFELKKQELELRLLENKLQAEEAEEAFKQQERQLRLKLLEKQIGNL